jgi:predicted RNase H-like HicB family nuclease/uncharacterized damage-inducible protein DinB
MKLYKVYLEVREDGRAMAHILELHGCFLKGKSREETIRGIPDSIRKYYGWLRKHGESVYPPDAFEIRIEEEILGDAAMESGDRAALFTPEKSPPDKGEVERFFKLMSYSRSDLLEVTKDLPGEILDRKPNDRTRTIRQILGHIARAEWWYLSRLGDWEELYSLNLKFPPEGIFEQLERVRSIAEKILRNFPEREWGKIFKNPKYTSHPEEEWTYSKVLRRFIEHEREHTENIMKILKGFGIRNI